MSTGTEALVVEHRGHVAVLTLNRPEKRNAVDAALGGALEGALRTLAADDAVRVVILTGAGPAFCAGADLSGTRPAGPGPVLGGDAPRLTAPLDRFAKPVVAAVNGPAFGGGCELALAADIRVAAASATFCLPEVAIGSMPGSGGAARLVHAVGSAMAAKLLLTGAPIDAAQAQSAGLVSDVFPDDALLVGALDLASKVAENAPLSLLAVKQVLRRAMTGGGGSGALDFERTLWALLSTTVDRAEGRAAFRERRRPRFEGQ